MDAEGLVLTKDKVVVSFEAMHRIDTFPAEGFLSAAPTDSQRPILPAGTELRHNGGLEAIALAPPASPLAARSSSSPSAATNAAGDLIAGIQDGPSRGSFYVRRTPPFSVTDADFLPDGSLLLLERRFGLADGIGCRIRRIPADAIRARRDGGWRGHLRS